MRSIGGIAASVFLLVATAASAAPARHASRHHPDSASVLVVRGDQVSTDGVVAAVAKAYAETGDGRLDVQPFNTIDGIDRALSGQVDIAASARPAYGHQESELTFTPVAWDALVFITNASNPVDNLSLKQVRDIYYHQITNWDKLGGRDEKIDLEGVFQKLDGVEFSFRQLMFGDGDFQAAAPRQLINIDSLQSDVALNTKGLALSTLAHARRQSGIKILSIEGVRPSLATLASGQYPLPMTIYLAYKPDSPKLAQIRQFLAFLGGAKAGGILRSHDLLPYAQATTLNAKTTLDRVNAVGAYLVAEGLPAAYAPGNVFAHLAGNPQEVARAAALQQAAAKLVEQQRASAAQAASATPKPAAATGKRYKVAKGDTLSRIAEKFSVSVKQLQTWNHLHGTILRIGQELQVSQP
ncbi:MAG TPA: substrate-binding domain-containing protein [Rhodanobacteraceae bacterium]|nr:substrate-binding domain-containing protein [Rhodanobacteraceae bacterium]